MSPLQLAGSNPLGKVDGASADGPRPDAASAQEGGATPGAFASLMSASSSGDARSDGDPSGSAPGSRTSRRAHASARRAGVIEEAEGVIVLLDPAPVQTKETPSSAGRGGALDLPTFLQALPRAGVAAAVAAGRDPGLAEALRSLPKLGEPAPRRSALPVDRDLKLPDFLAGLTASRSSSGPTAERSTTKDTPLEQRGAMHELLRAVPPLSDAPVKSASALAAAPATPAVGPAAGPGPLTAIAVPSLATAAQATATGDTAPDAEPDAASSPAMTAFSAPPGTEVWHDELSAQLSVMSGQGDDAQAVMKLAPPELGELEIRLDVRDRDAGLQFVASSAEVRQALEQAQPRLRELLAQQGMGLSNFSVSNGLTGNPRPDSQRGHDHQGRSRPERESVSEVRVGLAQSPSRGILDLYA